MKKLDNIRISLGITQEDLALLLKVTRSQLSLYEIGKRDLPVAAKVQLAEMLRYMQENTSKSVANTSLMEIQELQKKKALEQMLKNNQFKQLLLEKKIKAVEKKHATNLAALQLIEYLEKEAKKNKKPDNSLLKMIQTKAVSEFEKNGLALLTKYEIEKEVLQAEEKILLKKNQKA